LIFLLRRYTMDKLEKLTADVNKFNKNNIGEISFNGIETGIKPLDMVLNGGFKPGLTIIGAPPATGKSTLAYQIARNVSASGIPVIIFSLEMTKNQILAKMISRQTYLCDPQNAVSVNQMLNSNLNRHLTDEQWENIQQASDIVGKETDNIYIRDKMVTVDEIVDEVSAFIAQKNVKPLIIVDYLQIISGGTKTMLSDKQAVDHNIKALIETASAHGISMLLISSKNRSSYSNKSKKTQKSMASFKESGSIEYYADTLIDMERADDDDGTQKTEYDVVLTILKQRYGQSNTETELHYIPAYDCFSETDKTKTAAVSHKRSTAKILAKKEKQTSADDIEKDSIKDKFLALPEDKDK
ncbi:MAG: DnaB-like helicase C-terminal domain-containing protein, partial [Oscillospiraceae bacterium]